MARFEIVAQEGLKMIKCTIANETIRAESGSLHYMHGTIEMNSPVPTVGGFLKSVVSRENIFRPTYQGTGEIFFGPPIFGEYEILDLHDEEWILEQGSYVCSDAAVEIGVWRNKALTAFFGGEGWFQTSVKGTGQVVIQAPGKVQRIELSGEKLSVDGRFALARTAGINFQVQKAARSIIGSITSGEGLISSFEGTGTVLIAPVPNLYQNLYSLIAGAMPKAK
jgi:uncharacterized protein (AIM24 family)